MIHCKTYVKVQKSCNYIGVQKNEKSKNVHITEKNKTMLSETLSFGFINSQPTHVTLDFS